MQGRIFFLVLNYFLAGFATSAFSQKKTWYTHWGFSDQLKAKDPLDFDPATHLPPDHERFVWQLSLPKGANPAGSIPTFVFDLLKSEFVPAGSRQKGPFVQIEALRRFNFIHYYLVRIKGEAKSARFWVAGHYLKPIKKLPAAPKN